MRWRKEWRNVSRGLGVRKNQGEVCKRGEWEVKVREGLGGVMRYKAVCGDGTGWSVWRG